MSTLTQEQQKRIEENRARALAKLAEKKKKAASNSSNKHNSTNLSNQNKPSSSYNKNGNIQSCGMKDSTNMGLAKFQHRKLPSMFNTKPTTENRGKSINDALIKKSVVKGTCVLIDRTRFKVVVGFHAKLIALLKTLPSRCYDTATQTWNFLLQDHEKLMEMCKSLSDEVTISGLPNVILKLFLPQKISQQSENEIAWELIDKKLVENLMPFQREGVIFSIKHKGRVLLADDMGLGKTIQAIAVACYYKHHWPLLIIVPSSLRMTWRRAFLRWVPSVKPASINVVLSGKDNVNTGLVNIISYDLFVKKANSIKRAEYKVTIVDECHLIKNYKTERTKAILPILKSSLHVILISGTPALSRPCELHTQISSVDPRLFPSYHNFGVRYCAGVKNNFGWDYSGSSNMEELQLILEECIMIRRLKKDVLDQLPSKTREVVYLDPSLIKDKVLSDAEKQLVKAKNKDKRAALLEYFNETCSVKKAAVREYIMDLVESGHKMIVFAHHIEMLDVVSQGLTKKKVDYIRIDGKTLSDKRQHLCDQFQKDKETRVAVLSVTAANTGLTLTEATCVVFAELFWNPGALVQAEDRAYRIGQKNAVVIHYLLARKTADDYLWPLIQKKLGVLSEAGLNKEDFTGIETKTFQDPKQRNLTDMFETMFEGSDDELLAECGIMNNDNNIDNADNEGNHGSQCDDENRSLSAPTTKKADCHNDNSDSKDEWLSDLDDDDNWEDLDLSDSIGEPSAKRKRL